MLNFDCIQGSHFNSPLVRPIFEPGCLKNYSPVHWMRIKLITWTWQQVHILNDSYIHPSTHPSPVICWFDFDALAQGTHINPLMNYLGPSGNRTHYWGNIASCQLFSPFALDQWNYVIIHNPNDMPQAALDNWQPVWNAQVSFPRPVYVQFGLRYFDALAQGSAYRPTKKPINHRGPRGDRTHYIQTEAPYMHTYITYIHTHTRIHACIHACMHACIHTDRQMDIRQTHTHTYIHTYIHTVMFGIFRICIRSANFVWQIGECSGNHSMWMLRELLSAHRRSIVSFQSFWLFVWP